jgi:hypothetical protein
MPKIKDRKNYTMYNETLYEVERVVQIKWVKSIITVIIDRQFCYIKWKGYDERYNTWEPKEHITFCYNYVAPEEKDDDPEYRETANIKSTHKHHYQTRGKIRPPKDTYKLLLELEDKEDHTNMEEVNADALLNVLIKDPPEKNVDELELKSKNVDDAPVWKTSKELLISKILTFTLEEDKEERIGKVLLENGSTAYVTENVLRSQFPVKVIEYYESQFPHRAQKR